MATARHRPERGWTVRWSELEVTQNADGTVSRRWRDREKACPNERAALDLVDEIEARTKLGQNWKPEREQAVSTIGAIHEGFIAASRRSRKRRTARFHGSTLQRFETWAGEDFPASSLSADLLRRYADHLRAEGISTLSRYVAVVEQAWEWASKSPTKCAGVPPSSPSRDACGSSDTPRSDS